MNHAVRIHETGGPEVLRFEESPVGEPATGEALVRHTAVGLNFIDTYHRTGLYPLPLPAVLGSEAAGVVEAIGPGVTEVAVGDRVAYCGGPGAYAERRLIPSSRLVRLPDAISDDQGAALMLKGLTAWYLLFRTRPVQSGESIVVHSAAGGVGLLLCQWASALGARVIGVVSSDDKADMARANGAAEVLIYGRDPLADRVRALSGGGVPVVYDAVGKDTFDASLDCLRPLGLMVSYGNASGPVGPVNLLELSRRGSLFLTRPSLVHYIAARADLVAGADALFGAVAAGALRVVIGQRYPLAEVAQAHRDLEARKTVGSTVLVP